MNNENDYKANPVEGFGAKILSKSGWFKGRGIGKNSTSEIPLYIKQTPREERLGLGSEKDLLNKRKSEVEIGSTVEVTSGKHSGISGVVVSISEKSVTLEIQNNKTQIKVPILKTRLGSGQKLTQNQPNYSELQ